MFEVGQAVKYTPNFIGASGRSKFSTVAKVTAKQVTLKDGSKWTLTGKQWGSGRPDRWGYGGPRLVRMSA